MRDSADVARTTPLGEKPARAAEVAVTFTPVDVPTRQIDDKVTGLTTGSLARGLAIEPGSAVDAFARPVPANCHACGSPSDGADLFCITCGEFLEASEKPVADSFADAATVPACGDCGAETTEGEIFCMECGAVLS